MERINPSFATSDIYLAAAISAYCDIDPVLEWETARIFFKFDETAQIRIIVKDWTRGTLEVNARKFAQAIQSIRSWMFQKRDAVTLASSSKLRHEGGRHE